MKISTKGRYGVRLMVDIAINMQKGPVSLKSIAKRQNISEKYLWHLINPLKNAGLINVVRGSFGGYTLAKKTKDITLNDILNILEGNMCLVECTENSKFCNKARMCIMRDLWYEIKEKFSAILKSYTLEKIIERQKNRNSLNAYEI
jgi:Rrf2 family transcriptional regulator, cysteine metabolism repressor